MPPISVGKACQQEELQVTLYPEPASKETKQEVRPQDPHLLHPCFTCRSRPARNHVFKHLSKRETSHTQSILLSDLGNALEVGCGSVKTVLTEHYTTQTRLRIRSLAPWCVLVIPELKRWRQVGGDTSRSPLNYLFRPAWDSYN